MFANNWKSTIKVCPHLQDFFIALRVLLVWNESHETINCFIIWCNLSFIAYDRKLLLISCINDWKFRPKSKFHSLYAICKLQDYIFKAHKTD
jgi:hypothetical protein